MLLERTRIGVVPAVERLAALQAQWSPSPYLALWSRLKDFRREKLWSAIERHQVIRARLMRGTLHLVSARDFYAYAVATQDLQRGAWNRLQVGRGVDPKKVAALAIAFAREPRPKEDVLEHIRERTRGSLGGPFNFGANWDNLPALTREAFRVRSLCKTDDDARKNALTLSLEGIAQNITCPIFIVNGRLDRIVSAKDAERLAREVKGPVELMMIEDGNHIATNRAYRWRSQSADWLAEQLG